MSDVLSKGDRWLGRNGSPLRVHRSDAAIDAYKRRLKDVYGIAPAPHLMNSLAPSIKERTAPARYQPRPFGLILVLSRAIGVA
jgi:hypothetical protein